MTRSIFDVWYNSVSEAERQELDAIKNNPEEINDRFAAPLAFGTAGMRGVVGLGTYRMNVYTVARATAGLAAFINSVGKDKAERGVVISYDTRRFSFEFAKKAAEVLSAAGIKAHLFDNVHPVPMCSYAIRRLNAFAGIMITASHNPKEYNGYKVYGEDGAQMSPEDTAVVVKYINAIEDYFSVKCDNLVFPEIINGLDNVKINDFVTIIGKSVDEDYYAEISKLSLSPEAVKKYGKNLKLVYTPIHGSGYIPVTTVLDRMGINVTCVKEQTKFDTEFSTVPIPNPENPQTLKMGIELGNEIGADVVIGTDPDCDRMGLAVRDDTGTFRLLNGNQIGALLLDYIITRLTESGTMPKNPAVVKTIVTTTLADRIAKAANVKVFNVLTGFKFIGEKIKEWEKSGEYTFLFGYEESYGYLRGTHARDKDAVVASMLTAEMVCYYESVGKGLYKRLIELFDKFGYYREEVASIAYKGVTAMSDMSAAMSALRAKTIRSLAGYDVFAVSDYLKGVTVHENGTKEPTNLPESDVLKFILENEQFVCVRPSGTEPKLKIYVLCYDADAEKAKIKAEKLMAAIREEL
ncbi:MAG: phospho-sugar mutase [Eubacteriales bacterium]|nr:phospho-sugar mutase [Eubacteriales bacterium]